LWQVWALVSDPRDPRGRRHRLPSILALVQAAVTSGATTFAEIVHWIGVAPQYCRCTPAVQSPNKAGQNLSL
jgi:hypothetical protein